MWLVMEFQRLLIMVVHARFTLGYQPKVSLAEAVWLIIQVSIDHRFIESLAQLSFNDRRMCMCRLAAVGDRETRMTNDVPKRPCIVMQTLYSWTMIFPHVLTFDHHNACDTDRSCSSSSLVYTTQSIFLRQTWSDGSQRLVSWHFDIMFCKRSIDQLRKPWGTAQEDSEWFF